MNEAKPHIWTNPEPRPYKEVFPNATNEIVYAFSIGDEDYYQLHDLNEIATDRGFHALSYFAEMDMRCTKEFLKATIAAIKNVINDTSGIKIMEVAKLVLQLEERIDFLIEPEIALKLCSVVFFTADENPYRFNYKRAAENAAKFRDCGDDFFLSISSLPMKKLLPYIDSFANDFPEYLEMIGKINRKQLGNIFTMLSEADKKAEWFNMLNSRNV